MNKLSILKIEEANAAVGKIRFKITVQAWEYPTHGKLRKFHEIRYWSNCEIEGTIDAYWIVEIHWKKWLFSKHYDQVRMTNNPCTVIFKQFSVSWSLWYKKAIVKFSEAYFPLEYYTIALPGLEIQVQLCIHQP